MFNYGFPCEWSTIKKLIWLRRFSSASPSWVWQLLTGTAPLTLLDAVAHPIHSLVQFGKCVQDGTPTPDAPVDILCNNGVLKMVDDELPTGYKRLLGITFDGEVYYVTNYHIRGADTLRFSFKATETGRNVIGCYNGTDATDNLSFYFSTGSLGVYLRYNGGLYRPVASTNTVYNCVISPTGVTGLYTTASWTEVEFTSAAAMFIGWLDNAASPKFKGDMYGSIVVDGRANFIPVERQSDGAIGYWDGQAFLENQGTGTPVSLGYDDSHYQLSVDGTPETMTIHGENLITSTLTGYGTYVSPSQTAGTRAYKWFQDLPNGTYRIGVEGDYELIVQWRDPADSADGVAQSYENLTGWITSGEVTLNKSTGGYGIAVRRTVGTSSITPANFDGTLFCYRASDVQTVTDIPMLLSVGDYKDTAELIGGLMTHKVGIKVFDGTESWAKGTLPSSNYYYGGDTSLNSNTENELICNQFTVGTRNVPSIGKICVRNARNGFLITPNDQTIDTVEKFKQFLAAQYAAGTPVIVIYPLAAATTEQTTPHALHTSAGTNVVDVTANVSPVELAIEYAKESA